jgi:hypothetical protein
MKEYRIYFLIGIPFLIDFFFNFLIMKAYGKYFLMGIPLLIGTKIYFSGGSGLFVSKIYV